MKNRNDEFLHIIEDILNNETVQSLQDFRHHYGSNRLEHSLSVAYYSYKICKFLGLDYTSVARAGVLHDLFLYDCQDDNSRPKFHIWTHPKESLHNAKELFTLNKKEKDIILKHMWPTTFIPPRYLESFIVSCVDKYCAFKEWSDFCKFTVWSWYFNWLFI